MDCCNEALKKKSDYRLVGQKIELLKKLEDKNCLKEFLFELCVGGGDFSNFKLLKKESSGREWRSCLNKILPNLKKRKKDVLLSKIYYGEKDYKNAYEYFRKFKDTDYLELLARRLAKDYPELACEAYGKLCFIWIESGTGWCYKKAGKMLGKIKEIDRSIFEKVREKIISEYNKRWSLMKIIKKL